MMTRIASFSRLCSALAFTALLATGCEKPDEASCRKAIDNMRVLMGTENLSDNNKIESEVRRCKGGSSKKSVACAMSAKTYEELRACGFTKLPATLPVTPGAQSAGSATASGSAGSAAATGSADATGSAGTGSADATGSAGSAVATGSADASGSGSAAATGSADASGSARTGSATATATPTGPAGAPSTGSATATGSATR